MSDFDLNASKFECLPACFRHLEAVVVALIEADGHLLEANEGFTRLLGGPHPPDNVAPFFMRPGWATLVGTHSEPDQPVHSGLINLCTPDGLCRSLYGKLIRRGNQLLLVAEFNVRELEALNSQVVQLNERMAEMQRDLARSNRMLKASEARFRNLSSSDPLTGLANRRHLDEQIAREIERAQRYDQNFALILADIDHFKRVNDRYGHDVGDTALCVFAGMLNAKVRDCDLAARLGGEEFVVVLPQTDLASALTSAERLRVATGELSIAGYPERLSASFGVARFVPGDTIHTLLKRADQALYAAKEGGRNRVVTLERD